LTFRLADRVRDVWTGTGTGSVTVAGTPPQNHITFDDIDGMVNDDTCPYWIANKDVITEWEIGVFTRTGTHTYSRTPVASSNDNSLVAFTAGTKEVTLDVPSSKLVLIDADKSHDCRWRHIS
jgi:hypothetical protein